MCVVAPLASGTLHLHDSHCHHPAVQIGGCVVGAGLAVAWQSASPSSADVTVHAYGNVACLLPYEQEIAEGEKEEAQAGEEQRESSAG